ncbi:heme exporter protein CcmD [Marinobacter sp. F4216]|uniref:heme exporter protein CcmD n=1 Tax=Marinobacter sp. F4216 TaxID=2874281 RepID=UPI001CBA6BF5|nr:heme exporter protein CcmD [Marinobacter sp. F4216]MBZ2168336.1 heme exporter protein CcmD [Marinobacter sp. F4216]
MAFDSLTALIHMEGHGPYVWTCYGVFLLVMVSLVVLSVRKHNTVIQSCRRSYESEGGKQTRDHKPAATFSRVNISQEQ